METADHYDAVCQAMSEPAFYPHPVTGPERRDTHISTVFLTGDRAYKIKKPVNLGFLDFRDLALIPDLVRKKRWDELSHPTLKCYSILNKIEKKYTNPYTEEELYALLKDFKYIIPQGGPMSGIGNKVNELQKKIQVIKDELSEINKN